MNIHQTIMQKASTLRAAIQNITIFQTDTNYSYNKSEELLYLPAYALWLISALLNETSWTHFELIPVIRTYLNNTAYALLVIKFLTKKRYTAGDAWSAALAIFFCFLVSHTHYHQYIVPMTLFLCSASNVRYSQILKCTLVIQSVMMAVTITASQTGILEDVIWLQAVRDRHSFGYDYCAYPAHILLFITLIWFCIRKKIRIPELLLFSGLNYLMYLYTETRTDFYLSLLSICGFGILCKDYQNKWFKRIRNWITCWGFAVFAVLSILLHYFYNPDNPLMDRLNRALSQRLWLGSEAIKTYGFSLLGKAIRWIGQGSVKKNPDLIYNYVDCSFLKETLSYGIIFIVILGILFYLAGKEMIRTNNYHLEWATVIMLIYSSINAHLCMLVFNPFILIPGLLFSDKNASVSSEPASGEGTFVSPKPASEGNMTAFCDVIGTTFSRIPSDWVKSKLRIILFLLLFVYLIFIQHQGTEYMVEWSSMHMWVINISLFLLSILCWENRSKKERRSNNASGFARTMLFILKLFLLLVCISDFAAKKEFSYCGFFLLSFGGLLYKSWRTMENPGQLWIDFKYACKAGFFLILIYCLIFRPASFDICYTGICTDAESFGILMLIIVAVFLNDTLEKRMEYVNGACAIAALYLVFLTRKLTILPLAGILILLYTIFWSVLWFRSGPILRDMRTRKLLYSIIGGLAAVLLIHHLLHFLTPLSGLQVTYEYGQTDAAEITLFSLLFGEVQWSEFQTHWQSQFQIWGGYLNHLNLLGHKHLLKIDNYEIWPQNSFIMNLFRYGIPAGIAYLATVALYWGNAFYQSVKKTDFFLFSTAVLCTAASLLGMMDMPFAQIPWLIFYLTLMYCLIDS